MDKKRIHRIRLMTFVQIYRVGNLSVMNERARDTYR